MNFRLLFALVVLPAVAFAAAGDPNATATLTAVPAVDQIGANALILMILDVVKRSRLFPWVTENTRSLNRVIGYALAVIAGLGVGWTFDNSHHSLMITGLDPWAMLHNAWYAGRSIGLQQWMYDSRVMPSIGASTAAPEKLHAPAEEEAKP